MRKKSPCPCCVSGSPFVEVFKSGTNFQKQTCCAKEACPGLQLPHNPDYTPQFFRLRCCVREVSETQTTIPHHFTTPCQSCGLEKITPADCPHLDEATMERTLATWRKRQKEWYRINKGENKDKWVEREVLHDYTGTLKELWDEIQAGYKDYLLHRWVVDWTSWAFKLEIATFNGDEEILILSDYASQFKMHGVTVGTCEHPNTCNEYVLLVLHSPKETQPGKGEREVVCDYIRKGAILHFNLSRAD